MCVQTEELDNSISQILKKQTFSSHSNELPLSLVWNLYTTIFYSSSRKCADLCRRPLSLGKCSCVLWLLVVRERGGELVGGGVGIRPVDIAIGDGKNVSVNVTALSVPFSP